MKDILLYLKTISKQISINVRKWLGKKLKLQSLIRSIILARSANVVTKTLDNISKAPITSNAFTEIERPIKLLTMSLQNSIKILKKHKKLRKSVAEGW